MKVRITVIPISVSLKNLNGEKYKINEPVREKTNNLGFRPGPTQTRLYSRRWLEAGNFGFRKYKNCTICVAKTKALISFAVTAKLICAFVFAYADCWFSHAVAQICFVSRNLNKQNDVYICTFVHV